MNRFGCWVMLAATTGTGRATPPSFTLLPVTSLTGIRMIGLALLFFCLFLSVTLAQEQQASTSAQDQTHSQTQAEKQSQSATQDQNPNQPPANTQGQSRDRSVIRPKPGGEAIKPKDYSDSTGYWHPFSREAKYIFVDQKRVWTSPFRTTRRQAKWWVILGGATGALIATDKYVAKAIPNSGGFKNAGTYVSYLGEPYTLLPITAGLYFGGTAAGSDHFRETGLLAFETLADVTIVQLALKSVFDRERPLEGAGNGEFGASTGHRYNSSFPSGHSIETFALASVVAHEYHHKTWLKVVAYGYAVGVVGARLAAKQHFPGDVMAGAAMGWFMGDYVYGHRHNPALDKKPTITQTILNHIQIGGLGY
jgi:membrane-associated phospholipid phosphatase